MRWRRRGIGEGGEPPDGAATKRRRAAAGDAAAAEDAMFAPEVDMAPIDLLTIVNYLSEFGGLEGSLRYHVRGFETVKELRSPVAWSMACSDEPSHRPELHKSLVDGLL